MRNIINTLLIVVMCSMSSEVKACCTNLTCGFCVSSTSLCVCPGGPKLEITPVCNIFGCNCNKPCGTRTFDSQGHCSEAEWCEDNKQSTLSAQKRFNEIDVNSDQKISLAEGRSWAQRKQKIACKLTEEKESKLAGEYISYGEKLSFSNSVYTNNFKKTDADSNGYISPEEFDKSLSSSSSLIKSTNQ